MSEAVHTLGHLAATWACCWIWYRVGKRSVDQTELKLGRKITKAIKEVCDKRALIGDGGLTITHTETSTDEDGHQWDIVVKQHPAQEHLKA